MKNEEEFVKNAWKNMFYYLFMLISHLLVLGILCVIVNVGLAESNKFNYVYNLSKILTVKGIVLRSHNSKIIDGFSSSGTPIGLPTTYKNYLKLIKNDRCIENYKPCGILDTYGNLLCIDDFFQCPINKMKVDLIARANNYLNQNYDSAPLSQMSKTHQFFYSNDFINENGKVIIIKTDDEPKYITYSNFIIDTQAYKEKFGDLDDIEFLDDVLNIFDNNNNNNEEDDLDKVIKIVQLIQTQDDNTELIIKGAKVFTAFLSYSYKKKVKEFEIYVKEKIDHLEEEKNIDAYYNHLGDNFYDKNYIGFKNIQDLNKFMNFDYNIYKEKFPNHSSSIWAAVSLSLVCILIIYLLFSLFNYKFCYEIKKASGYIAFITMASLLFYSITLGFMIYSIIAYIKLNKNPKLNELKSISADKFISDFIDEFVSLCQENNLLISCICINIFAFIIHISSLILYFKEFFKK